MGYFDFFPNTIYRSQGPDFTVAKNLMTRVRILSSLKDSQSTFSDYSIIDGERPETLAYRVYGRADYHWIILLFNEIHDPFFSWPLSNDELEYQVEKIYGQGRISLFVHSPSMILDAKQNTPFDFRNVHLQVGDIVEQIENKTGNNAVVATGIVEEWNPNLMKVVVKTTSGSFRTQQQTSESGVISTISGMINDLRFKTKDQLVVSVPLVRINTQNISSVHHFATEDGEVISPWTNTCDHLKSPVDCVCFSESGSLFEKDHCSVIEAYVLGNAESGILVNRPEMRDNLSVSLITNYQYEYDLNESKRKIKVMRPEYIDVILREFRNTVNSTLV